MRFGHAIYGERDRGHRLLSASASFPDPETLAGRMDMQGSPPPHTDWKPYLSGFAWQNHYVLARTMADARSERSGMVFSRTLAIPASAVAELHDIYGLMEFLSAAGDARDQTSDVAWMAGSCVPSGDPGLVQAMLADGAPPVIWSGQDGFDAALAALWRHLWASARLALSFRIAFSPTDVGNDAPKLVTTPERLISRWSGYRIVQADAQPDPANAAERYLIDGDQSDDLARLLAALGERMPNIPDLRGFVDVEALLQGEGDLSDHIDALRRICHLAPEPGSAPGIKAALITKAAREIAEASASEIRMARNLDLSAAAAADSFWEQVAVWAAKSLWKPKGAAGLSAIISDALSEKPVAPWREAIKKGARAALTKPNKAVARAVWEAMQSCVGFLENVITVAGSPRRLEAVLVDTAPKSLSRDVAEPLTAAARQLSLWYLHAACCAASLNAVEAIRHHLVEAKATLETLAIASRRASDAELVAIALEHDDVLTLALAVEAVSRTPSLLRAMSVSDPRWRSLWRAALDRSPEAVDAPANPGALMSQLMDGAIDGAIDDPELLIALSKTRLADVTSYPRRSELWAALPEAARSGFIDASADGWLAVIEAGQEVAYDEELTNAISLPTRLYPALERLAAYPDRGSLVFRAVPALDQYRFGQWFQGVLQVKLHLDRAEAEALGRLIASRNWEDAARALADEIVHHGRQDLRPAVDYVVELIGMIRRYELDELGNSIPVAAKWSIVEEIALELYGYGPGDGALWQRAGGKESDIPKLETGRASWRKVLGDAQKGKGDIDIGKLLKRMSDDYPHHRMLQKLRSDSLFRSRS